MNINEVRAAIDELERAPVSARAQRLIGYLRANEDDLPVVFYDDPKDDPAKYLLVQYRNDVAPRRMHAVQFSPNKEWLLRERERLKKIFGWDLCLFVSSEAYDALLSRVQEVEGECQQLREQLIDIRGE